LLLTITLAWETTLQQELLTGSPAINSGSCLLLEHQITGQCIQ
jgi:hypothetical protein